MNDPKSQSGPPAAARKPHSYTRHGVTVDDPWAWLRDPAFPELKDPAILDYLTAENGFFGGWKAKHQGLLDTLFAEMKGRIKDDDRSVPIKDGDWLYWWAFTPGAQYRTWYRK
ncbi:MAG: S9 family peptidase, partial [Pseudomonadota bacterium]